ncbi:MAG: hypothetical protein M3032_11030 [Verrucomicrobiota bacterium]|nr:hypothetical protein [Verrucomicrobiota bacterium]
MRRLLVAGVAIVLATSARAQIQVDLKFKRVQYIAYEPIVATVEITNLAGRDIELHDAGGERWFGFEITADEGRFLERLNSEPEPPLRIESGKTVSRKVNLTPLFPIHDLGPYHAKANLYFADLDKFFYSPAKVFQVVDVRPFWQRTVGVPQGERGAGEPRTYSLMSNRFPDHTSLYVRIEDKSSGAVYNTFSLGRSIAFDEPQAEIDVANRLHVLHCAAPRTWSYARIGPNGELLSHSTILETKTRPRLRRTADGAVNVNGGMVDAPVPSKSTPKLSDRPPSQDD